MEKIAKKDIDIINKSFDSMIKDYTETAEKSKKTMPLVAKSLELTVELVKTYKEAFNSVNK